MTSWANSERRSQLPADWPKRVAQVKKRDGGRCRWILPLSGARCPRPGVDVDHRYGPHRHSLDDLWLLCREHHDKKTALEAIRGKRAKRARGRPRRTEEPHPGLRR